jgi:tetrahydromethanopterin S-methyltransferase subunit G
MDKQSFVEVNKQLENMSKDIEGIRSSVSTMAGCVFGGALGLFISGIIKLKF